ncbi:MAG TPA: prolyl oligopeptidase family serine peptidase, partial [Bdellovibrionota bacterium]|nr:prolyl oligopeptidase family serine peptidase [Bdellovibrionota bacterium]
TEALQREGYSSPAHTYSWGASAGGLLVGATLNLRPDLFNGVIAQVPFVDVINTMLDATIPLTTAEYDEWGDPRKKADYEYILQYSPYDNVRKARYPHLLVTAGLHDSQVQYWEAAKWVARIRKENPGSDRLVLLKTDLDSGHGGKAGRFQRLDLTADILSFLVGLERGLLEN